MATAPDSPAHAGAADPPLVSVIIPAYNAEAFLEATIDSVLAQTLDRLEVIVIDDGSTDRTAALAAGTGDPRVRVVSIPNGGQARARNHGLELARGEAVCFLDADDLWAPGKLAAQLPRLTGDTVVVGAPFRYVTSRGRVFGRTGENPLTQINRDKIRRGDLLPFPLSSALMSRSAVLAVGGFDPALAPAEDLDLYTRLAQQADFAWVPEPLGAYRVHASSDSVASVRLQRRTSRFIVERTAARAAGLPDPPPVAHGDAEPGPEDRVDAAALAFRLGALHLVSGAPVAAARAYARAMRSSPSYVLRRADKRLRGLLPLAASQPPATTAADTARATATDILGVHVSAVDQAGAVEAIAAAIASERGGYVCVTGVHGVMESQRDAALLDIHNRSLLTVPDGMPMVWLSRRAGATWVSRVYGPDLMLAVLARGANEGWTSYLYGGGDGVVEALAESLARKIPGFRYAGGQTPPFRPLTGGELAEVAEDMLATGPALVWVGLSTPKQERFMAEMAPRVPGVVFLGVGAAFDFHIGRVSQAPSWMQKRGLEWLFRLIVEPRRLWRRYLTNNPAFVMAILRRKPVAVS